MAALTGTIVPDTNQTKRNQETERRLRTVSRRNSSPSRPVKDRDTLGGTDLFGMRFRRWS